MDKEAKIETALLRIKNDLRMSNYTSLKDFIGKNKKEWLEYRQALRDLPKDPRWPDMPWPVRPKEPPLKTDFSSSNIAETENEEDEHNA